MKKHLKTLATPRTWAIPRKNFVFITRPNPGAHTLDYGMPLALALKFLQKAKTKKEIKQVLTTEEVIIDGKRRKDFRFNVGFMDTISIPKLNEHYRVLINCQGFLSFLKINLEEANLKLCKIKNKHWWKGKMQMTFTDGRMILSDKPNKSNSSSNYSVGDSLLIELPSQKIKSHFKLEPGAMIFLQKGKYIGLSGKLEKIEGENITFKHDQKNYKTKKKYAFVIGKDKPEISL